MRNNALSRAEIQTDIPLRVTQLSKRYGDFEVLKQLNLEVTPGAVHGLVGLNGSGKTTTLECLLGMQAFQSGEVRLLGLSPDHLHKSHGGIVSIFDSPSLHPHLTVRQVLEHASLLCDQIVRSPEEVEALLGITRYSNFRIRTLSLGNRRRASIAQALLGSPRFVILDEPFNGLDAGGVDDVLALISKLNREEGTSFLLSSHQLPYLEKICSHLSILHKGQIVVSDRVDQLFSAQQSRLQVYCDDVVRACAIVQDMRGVTIEDNSATGILTLQLDNIAPSLVNQRLVEKGIMVDELVRERASLTSLFHDITALDPAAEVVS